MRPALKNIPKTGAIEGGMFMELARVFADNMVLQRRRPICIWGICDTAQMVTVRLQV